MTRHAGAGCEGERTALDTRGRCQVRVRVGGSVAQRLRWRGRGIRGGRPMRRGHADARLRRRRAAPVSAPQAVACDKPRAPGRGGQYLVSQAAVRAERLGDKPGSLRGERDSTVHAGKVMSTAARAGTASSIPANALGVGSLCCTSAMRWPVLTAIRTWTARRREIHAHVRDDLQGSAEASPAAALVGAAAMNAGFKIGYSLAPGWTYQWRSIQHHLTRLGEQYRGVRLLGNVDVEETVHALFLDPLPPVRLAAPGQHTSVPGQGHSEDLH